MLATLNKWGGKLLKSFGEPSRETGNKHSFSGDPISNLLPWESYDEESHIFVGENTLGFTIESIPLVGSSNVADKEISSIFEEVLEEGDSLQCLLLADHRVAPFLDRWKKGRENAEEIYQEIAHKRAQFYQNTQSINPRIFRCIFSYSTQAKWDSEILEKLKEKKEKILNFLCSFVQHLALRV